MCLDLNLLIYILMKIILNTNYKLKILCTIDPDLTLKAAIPQFRNKIIQTINENYTLSQQFTSTDNIHIASIRKDNCYIPVRQVIGNVISSGQTLDLQLKLKQQNEVKNNSNSQIQQKKNLFVNKPKIVMKQDTHKVSISNESSLEKDKISAALKRLKTKLIKKEQPIDLKKQSKFQKNTQNMIQKLSQLKNKQKQHRKPIIVMADEQ